MSVLPIVLIAVGVLLILLFIRSRNKDRVVAQLPAAEVKAALRDRNILIIGGTAGIGKALAAACVQRGAKVTVVGRRSPGPELAAAECIQKDLSTMKNASALADEVDASAIDTIVFTSGIFANSERQVNTEGIELDLAVSYLNRYVFARKIVEKGLGSKRKSSNAIKPRIFVMGFPGAKEVALLDDFNSEKSYKAMPAHMNTVVANEALVTFLNNAFKGSVNVFGLSPGLIKTEIRDNFLGKGSWKSWIAETLIGLFTPSAEQYAERTLVHLLASPELEDKPGLLIGQKRTFITPNPFLTQENIDRVMAESAKLADRALASSQR